MSFRGFLTSWSLFVVCFAISDSSCFFLCVCVCFLSDSLCKCSLGIAYSFSSINAFFIIGHIQNQLESGRDACFVPVGTKMVSGKLSASLPLPGLSIFVGHPPANLVGSAQRDLC